VSTQKGLTQNEVVRIEARTSIRATPGNEEGKEQIRYGLRAGITSGIWVGRDKESNKGREK
jgi:hypothetical protein